MWASVPKRHSKKRSIKPAPLSVDLQREFLRASSFAVAGASIDRAKYGNLVLRALVGHAAGDSERIVFPLNPNADSVEGIEAYASIDKLPRVPESLSIVTPPAVTRQIVQDAIQAGVQYIWMQPGAEDDQAIELARASGIGVIADGACVLVAIKTLT